MADPDAFSAGHAETSVCRRMSADNKMRGKRRSWHGVGFACVILERISICPLHFGLWVNGNVKAGETENAEKWLHRMETGEVKNAEK